MIPVDALVEKLTAWNAVGTGSHAGTFQLGNWSLKLSATSVDSMGARLTAVEMTRSPELPDDPAVLEKHAQLVAQRVTGLLEPLAFLEIDRSANVAILRSANPPVKGDHVFYYEAKWNGRNQASLVRYKANRLSPAGREAVPFILTHEAIAKLANDLAGE